MFKYTACGESLTELTVVHVSAISDLLVHPIEKNELIHSAIINWSLENKERIVSTYSTSMSTLTEHNILSFDLKEHNEKYFHKLYFNEFFSRIDAIMIPVLSNRPSMPDLRNAYTKGSFPVSVLHGNIFDALRIVARDLKETKPNAGKDSLERLAGIGRDLLMFSLDELRLLWQEIKGQDSTIAYVSYYLNSSRFTFVFTQNNFSQDFVSRLRCSVWK